MGGLLASIFGGLFGAVGNGVKGFFDFKGAQADVVKQAITTIGDINASDAQREAAMAQVMAAEATSSGWLTRNWRPLIVIGIFGMVLSWWFGYSPPNIDKPMPESLHELFNMAMTIVGIGYGGRTVEKVIKSISLGSVLKTIVNKKIM